MKVKRFKKMFVLSVATLFMGVFLAGCALFATDVARVNNLVVATIRKPSGNIEITRRQLDDAFSSWGFQQEQQGMSRRQAVRGTLDQLIDREIMVYLSIDTFGRGDEQGMTGALTYAEYNQARRTVIQSFDSWVNGIHADVRRENNVQDAPAIPDQEESPLVFTPHNQYILVSEIGGVRTFSRDVTRFATNENETPALSFYAHLGIENEDGTANQSAPIMGPFAPRGNSDQERTLATLTRNRAMRTLRHREQGLAANWSELRLVMFEMERMQREVEMNILVQRFNNMHAQGIMNGGRITTTIDDVTTVEQISAERAFEIFSNRFNGGTEATSLWRNLVNTSNENYIDGMVNMARDIYERRIREQVLSFQQGRTTEDQIRSNIISGVGDVHWAPSNITAEFFTVSHILISLSDEDQAEIARLNATQMDDEERQTRIREIQIRTVGNEGLSAYEVLEIVERDIATAHRNGGEGSRQEIFRDLMYRFGTDPGMQNAAFEYTMGRDRRAIDVTTGLPYRHFDEEQGEYVYTEPDSMTQMVVPFTNASRELFNWNNETNRSEGTIGDISGVVWSDFGAHIIMYTRNVSDMIFSSAPTSFTTALIDQFMFQTQTSFGNKTFFDAIVDEMSRTEFSRAQNNILAAFKLDEDTSIRIHQPRFNDMW